MAIKVHGSIVTPTVLRVFACLYEKDVEAEYVPVNLASRDHKKQPFLTLNPFGQVPGFEDGDLKLFESRAINKYIIHAYDKKGYQLIFHDPKKMGPVYVWMEVESQRFDPIASKLVFETCIKPIFGLITDDAVVEEYRVKLGEVLDVYEARLKHSKYLAADTFTLADLNHLPAVNYLAGTKLKAVFDARPHVSAWCADILARPAWKKVLDLKEYLASFLHIFKKTIRILLFNPLIIHESWRLSMPGWRWKLKYLNLQLPKLVKLDEVLS